MQAISIATNEDSVFIHIDKKAVPADQLIRFLELVRLNFTEVFHIPEVSDEEQQELEVWLEMIPDSDKEFAFSRLVEL